MMKIVKFIFVISFVLFLFIFWHNANNKQVNISSSPVALFSLADAHFHCGVHNCAWDGDDVLAECQAADMVSVLLAEVYISALSESPSLRPYSIWQPPKFS